MMDVMLDLETMGTGSRAAIVAIGAVKFDIAAKTVVERFHQPISLKSSIEMGGEMDADTVLWWMRQGDEARSVFAREAVHVLSALMNFTNWLNSPIGGVSMWGNGAGFDNVILANAYRGSGLAQPWSCSHDRCYRTIKSQHPGIKIQRVGVHHNAVDDAESQALHLIAMLSPPDAFPCVVSGASAS